MRRLRAQAASHGLTLLAAVSSTAPVHAQTTPDEGKPPETQGLLPVADYSGDWISRAALTGDWNGVRQKWADQGFTTDIHWTQYGQGVLSGGVDEDWELGGSIDALFRADLMRMGLVPGALVTMRAESRYGESVNGISGLLLPVNTQSFFPLTTPADEDLLVAITELNYTQFLTDQFGVLVGKIQTMDSDANEFAGGRGRAQFMNFALVVNPVTALTAPYSTLAAGGLWLPSENVTLSSVVFNLTDSSTTSGFDDFGDGAAWSTEVGFQWDGDLPGGSNIGATYAFDADFSELGGKFDFNPGVTPTLESESTSWAVYSSAWQYLSTESGPAGLIDTHDGRPDLEGIGLFSRLGFADPDTNPIDWSASVGVGGRGLIPSRDDDTCGLGYFYSNLQQPRSLLVNLLEDRTQGVELFYDIALARSVSLTLDTQWVQGAFSDVDDAFLLGFRLSASL